MCEKIVTDCEIFVIAIGKDVVKWNYVQEKVEKTDKWIHVENRFEISNGIRYIEFGLTGVGTGEYRFDDIIFRKEYVDDDKGKKNAREHAAIEQRAEGMEQREDRSQ